MGSQAGWRIVRGRARYWDGDQWVGGDFDPETVSAQMLAESAGASAPSVRRAAQAAAVPSVSSQRSGSAPSAATGGMVATPPASTPSTPSTPRPAPPAAQTPRPTPPPFPAQKPPQSTSSGVPIGRIIGFIVAGWILLQVLGGLLGALD